MSEAAAAMSEVHKTPANAVNARRELRPLPLRVATSQYERLSAARDRTGISIQEHVRRSIDLYLGIIEREAMDLGLMPERSAAAMPVVAAKPIAKVRKR
jgi:hypothetical protein